MSASKPKLLITWTTYKDDDSVYQTSILSQSGCRGFSEPLKAAFLCTLHAIATPTTLPVPCLTFHSSDLPVKLERMWDQGCPPLWKTAAKGTFQNSILAISSVSVGFSFQIIVASILWAKWCKNCPGFSNLKINFHVNFYPSSSPTQHKKSCPIPNSLGQEQGIA